MRSISVYTCNDLKIAIVHDWLTNMAGAEKVLLEIKQAFPEADIFTSVYDPDNLPQFKDLDIKTTWLQKTPFLKYNHQFWAWLRPFAFRSLNLKDYDVIICTESAEAKNARGRKDALHISYNNTPIRYYWSHYTQYKSNPGFGKLNFIVRGILPIMVPPLRRIDYKAAQKIDYFIANSSEIKRRVMKHYNRNSTVINPPVDYKRFVPKKTSSKRSGYIIAGRQVAYKRFDLAIAACNRLGINLTVVGDGPEHEKLVAMAGKTIKFKTNVNDKQLVELFHSHEAFIFPAEEDFGIVPIEAMAAGMPVIAYAKGGVEDWMIEDKTGKTFNKQTVESLLKVLKNFNVKDYKKKDLLDNAQRFSASRFQKEIKKFVEEKYSQNNS